MRPAALFPPAERGMPGTYKIGEDAALLNLKTYVLRFWETEFPQIAPLRTETGRRVYTA